MTHRRRAARLTAAVTRGLPWVARDAAGPRSVDETNTVRWLSRFAASFALTEQDVRALRIVRERGAIDNAGYRTSTGGHADAAGHALRRLREVGLLAVHRHGAATYYTPTEVLRSAWHAPHPNARIVAGFHPANTDRLRLPDDVAELLRRVREHRATSSLIEVAILRLCALRPLAVSDVSSYIQRSPSYVRATIHRLVTTHRLQYQRPESRRHPRQAYTTVPPTN